jgi:hypothetical protein
MTDHAAAADLLLNNWAATTRITELPEALRPRPARAIVRSCWMSQQVDQIGRNK